MADYDRFNLRFTEELGQLRAQLEAAAKKNNRSLHQEIMARLAGSFEPSAIESRLTDLERQVAELRKKKG